MKQKLNLLIILISLSNLAHAKKWKFTIYNDSEIPMLKEVIDDNDFKFKVGIKNVECLISSSHKKTVDITTRMIVCNYHSSIQTKSMVACHSNKKLKNEIAHLAVQDIKSTKSLLLTLECL